jgi:hypothetical protein
VSRNPRGYHEGKDEMMDVEQLEPYQFLIGTWRGKGVGGQGPFSVRAQFEVRGRWILLRHEISPPGNEQPFYVSTQVLGFDESGLTLDYFDTAGSFHFRGKQANRSIEFSWKREDLRNTDLWKTSAYELVDKATVRFKYQSYESQDGGDPVLLEFEGEMTSEPSAN